MILGIDCSRYAASQLTGVEVYTDRVIEGILAQAGSLGYQEIRLYVKNQHQVEQLKKFTGQVGQSILKVYLIERGRAWTLIWLSWELIRRPIDVLFVPSHTLPFLVPRKSLLTVHGVEALLYPKAYTWTQRWYQWISIWWAKWNGAKLMAVSKAVRNDLAQFFQIEKKDVAVVWNGFDRKEKRTKKDLQERRDLLEGEYVLHVGRIEERKNQLRLVEAFEKIAPEFKKLQLVLVGPDGLGAQKVKQKVENSLVRERIYMAGYLDREIVQTLLEKATVFAFPSLAEGFGMPVLEAMDAGVAVLTSKGSATEEVGGEAVVLCDPLSVDSIAEGLRQLLADEKLRGQKVREGKKRIDLFSWERCVEGVAEELKSLHD
ncbi:MAG: glycosyltransferase family 4 protein [Candidatus Altimarinota bacterium]